MHFEVELNYFEHYAILIKNYNYSNNLLNKHNKLFTFITTPNLYALLATYKYIYKKYS